MTPIKDPAMQVGPKKGQDEDSLIVLQALLQIRTETPTEADNPCSQQTSSVPNASTLVKAQNNGRSMVPQVNNGSAVATLYPKPSASTRVAGSPHQMNQMMCTPQMGAHPHYSMTATAAFGNTGNFVHRGLPTNNPYSNISTPSRSQAFHPGYSSPNFPSAQRSTTTGPNSYGAFGSQQNIAASRTIAPPVSHSQASKIEQRILPSEAHSPVGPVGSTPSRKRKKSAGGKSVPEPSTSSTPVSPPSETAASKIRENVRQAEIDAALRSLPQRGRKRENLSTEERMELTRTRNREHAKSTRVRKKARYQELLDNEKKCHKLEHLQDLIQRRQKCILNFLAIRTRMIQRIVQGGGSPERDPGDSRTQVGDEHARGRASEVLNNGGRSVSFSDGLMSADNEPIDDVEVNEHTEKVSPSDTSSNPVKMLSLNDVVENISSFAFEQPMRSASSSSEPAGPSMRIQGVSTFKGISAMKDFDRDLIFGVAEQFAQHTPSSLSYRVKGSESGMAISSSGAGFLEVEILVRPNPRIDVVFQSAIVKVQFAEGSSKLCHVRWFTVNETSPLDIEDSNHSHSSPSSHRSASSSDSLVRHKSFPSVVSLEQSHGAAEHSAEKPQGNDTDGGSGPGMDI